MNFGGGRGKEPVYGGFLVSRKDWQNPEFDENPGEPRVLPS